MKTEWLRKTIADFDPYFVAPIAEKHVINANENYLNVLTIPGVKEELIQALDTFCPQIYPKPMSDDIREALADYIGGKAENFIVGNGGDEMITYLLGTFLDPGDQILIHSPTFDMYELGAETLGASVIKVKDLPGYRRDQKGLLEAVRTYQPKVTVICNPNNPTGALYPKEVLQQIVDLAREHQLMIFSDEIYDRLVMDGLEHISIASLAPDLFCVTFSGLSKSHMIAGWRVGWMVLSGNKRLAKDYIEGLNMLANMRMCSNVPAQSVVQTALGGHQSVKDYLVPGGRIYDQRELVYNMLNDIPGITAVKPKAAFYIFPKIDVKKFNIHSDEQFALDLLHDKHILISHGGAFNWQEPDHFRVVYLPRISMLKETIGEIGDFFSTYWQA